jgi:hypothetical protein
MKTMRVSNHRQVLYPISLPKPGTVLVRTGDEVKCGDVLAETRLPERFLVYDVVNQLKLDPHEVERRIHRLVGESFVAGDVIAQKPGLFSRLFRARQNGKVVSIRDGKVVLALGEMVETVSAPFPGVITELIYERGAVIATVGSVLEGVLAGDGQGAGELVISKLELDRHKRLVDGDAIRDKICFCETLNHAQLLIALVEAGVAGLVLGSISPTVYASLQNSKLAWLLLGGFGTFELDSQTLALMETMKGEMVYLLDAQSGQPPMLLRIADQAEEVQDLFTAQEGQDLRVGAKVKLWGQPYQGRVGEVIELPEEPAESSCGGSIMLVVVKLTNELTVRVPVENLVKILD